MAERKQNVPEEKQDKYEQLKEELGYDDLDIRALAGSVKMKALGILGDARERKMTYLMREREKRDKDNLKYIEGGIPEGLEKSKVLKTQQFLDIFKNSDEFLQYIDVDKRLKGVLVKMAIDYGGFIGSDLNRLKKVIDVMGDFSKLETSSSIDANGCLVKAGIIYGQSEEVFDLIADFLCKHDGYLAVLELIDAKVVYGDDIEMLKAFLDVADAKPGVRGYGKIFNNLEEASSIYGNDKILFNIFIEAAKEYLYLPTHFLKKNPDLYTFNGVIDPDMLKSVLRAAYGLEMHQRKALQSLLESRANYGNDRERFEILADIFLKNNYARYEDKNLEKFNKIRELLSHSECDNVKLKLLVEVPDMAEEIIKILEIYGSDMVLLLKLVELVKEDKYGANFAVVKQFARNNRNYEYFSVFLDIVMDRGVEAGKAMIKAAELYDKNPKLFPIFVDVAKSGDKTNSEHSYRALRSLLQAGRNYGDNPKMFAIYADLAKEDRGILCENFFECRSLYGDDLERAELVKTKMVDFWEKWKFYGTEPLAKAHKLYGADMDKFDYVMKLIDKLATKDRKVAYEFGFMVCEYVSSIKMLEALVDKFLSGADRRKTYILAGLQGMFGDDVEKMDEVSSLLDDLSGRVSDAVLTTLGSTARVYGVKDEKSLMELVEILGGVEKIAGSAACRDLDYAHRLYRDKKMFMAFVEVAMEKGADAVHILKESSNFYKDNENRFYDFVSLIKKNGAGAGQALKTALDRKNNADKVDEFIALTNKQGEATCRVLADASLVYGDNMPLFQVFYKICMEGYSDLLSAMLSEDELKKLLINACESFIEGRGNALSGSTKGLLESISDDVLQKLYIKSDWYKQIFVIAKLVQIKKELSPEVKKILDVQGQVNIPAVTAKIDSHFEPFDFAGEDGDKKLKLLSLYADFLKDFNGVLVPVVWHLYCVLKNPALAASMANYNEINNIREIEHIIEIDDLRRRIKEIKEGVLLGHVDMESYKNSGLALAVLDDMARVSASDWKRANRPLNVIVGEYEEHEDDIIENFNPKIYKSGFIPVREVTEPLKRDPALTQEVLKAQKEIKRFISEDGSLIGESDVLVLIRDDISGKIEQAKERAERAVASGKSASGEELSDKAINFTKKSISQMEEMRGKVNGVDTLEGIVHILLSGKIVNIDIETELRAIFYYFGVRRQHLADGDSWVTSDPQLVDASKLGEFLNDTILLEVVQGKSAEEGPDVKLDKKERKLLKKEFVSLLNFLNQKQEEERVYKEKSATSVKNIAVLAGRGLLAELSGFYCDACWTGKSNILYDNPTMVGHTFVEEFENKERSRIIGGCLTLESSIQVKDQETGKETPAKVLVVRGLNPQNAYLNKYVVEDFVENFLDYVQETARKAGAEYVVLPLHTTGALSNRPQIISYLQKKYGEGERVSLNDDIDFNGYKIKDSCVVVRVVNENARKAKLPKPSNVPVEEQDHWIGSW